MQCFCDSGKNRCGDCQSLSQNNSTLP
jgi:hypothetical protein